MTFNTRMCLFWRKHPLISSYFISKKYTKITIEEYEHRYYIVSKYLMKMKENFEFTALYFQSYEKNDQNHFRLVP